MDTTTRKAWYQAIFASLGAGIASALLCVVLQPQSLPGALLFLLSPLPLMIAGFSYHPMVAALGALIGCLFLQQVIGIPLAIAYALMAGLPAWLVCEGSLRSFLPVRLGAGGNSSLSPGAILFGIAIYAALLIFLTSLWISGSYEDLRNYLYTAFEETIRVQYGIEKNAPLKLPDGTDLEPVGKFYARLMPALAALPLFILITGSAYLGARVANISGRFPRIWPDFRELRLPWIALPLMGFGIGLAMTGGYFTLAGELLMLVLSLCYMLQGLAVLHFNLRNRPDWRWLIGTSWILIIVFGVFGIGFALIGLADPFLDLRKLRSTNSTPNI